MIRRVSRQAVAAALLATACAGQGPSDATVVEFWAMGREGEVVQELVPEFERRHPGIRVRVQQMPWTAAHEKLVTARVGNATPDVAQLGNTWIPEFVALGALAPLDRWVARSTAVAPADFFSGIWATNLLDRTLYGVPWYVDTRVLFYRTDLLAAAGYDSMPVTWAEWREAMRRLADRMGEHAYPIVLPTNEWPQPVIFGMQAGSPLVEEAGRGAFSQAEFRRGFEFYIGLFREDLAPVIANTQMANLYQSFDRGEFAMVITGPWYIREFKNRLPAERQDDWGTAPLPGPDGPGISLAGGSSLVLFESSPRKEAAWRWIEYLSEPATQLRFYELSGDLPAVTAAWEESGLAEDRYARAFWEQLQRVEPTPKVPEWERIVTRVYEYGEAAARGRLTVEQALVALDRDVDRILAKRRWMLAREDGEP